MINKLSLEEIKNYNVKKIDPIAVEKYLKIIERWGIGGLAGIIDEMNLELQEERNSKSDIGYDLINLATSIVIYENHKFFIDLLSDFDIADDE